MQKIRVWDLPTRVFHWLLFLGVLVALVTGEEGEEGVLSIHQLFGAGISWYMTTPVSIIVKFSAFSRMGAGAPGGSE